MYIMQGTYSGMMSALIAGGIISLILFVMRRMFGYKKLTIRHQEKKIWKYSIQIPSIHWREFKPEGFSF